MIKVLLLLILSANCFASNTRIIHADQINSSDDTKSFTMPAASGVLVNSTDLSGYEPVITPGTSLQYWRGDKTFQTLNSTAVPEGSNLYFTTARARTAISASSPLSYNSSTGDFSCNVSSGSQAGCLSSSDFNAFNAKQAAGNYITALTADVSASGPGAASATVNSVGGSIASAVNTATVAANAATDANTASTIIKRDSNGNFKISDPASSQDASTKNYVDTQLSYLNPADRVQAASISSISGSYVNLVSGVCIGDTFTTTATTALAVDGYTASIGDRILFKNQGSTFQNGVWKFTTQAVGGVSGAVLIRALDFDTSESFNSGQIIPVVNGTQAGSSWYQTANITTCSSDTQVWTKFQNAASAYLLSASNLSDIASSLIAFNNISGMTLLGDLIYGGASGARTVLAGNTTTTRKVLTQTGNGSVSAAPGWNQLACADLSNSAASCSTDATNASNITSGTHPTNTGGTGQTTYTDGQLLIGNSSGNTLTKATLTAGSNITITNGNGSITIASTGGGGSTLTRRMFTVKVGPSACGSDPCTISEEADLEGNSVVSSANRDAAGAYHLTITGGRCSVAPTCTGISASFGVTDDRKVTGPTENTGHAGQHESTTYYPFHVTAGAGTLTDSSFELHCVCTK